MFLPRFVRKDTTSVMKSTLSTARSRLDLNRQHLRLNSTSAGVDPAQISSASHGKKFTSSFKQYATANNKVVSWFHDVPMGLDTTTKEVNMVVEIPRWSNAKFEIDTQLEGNPIVQDEKKGEVRFVKNLFPHHGYIHNYGAISQTWEDPTTKHDGLDLFGDNDPLDVCDIGASVLNTGDIKRVKILGSIALIDDGELDWKVIAINVEDPLSQELFDIHDLYVKCPGLLETTRQWFRDYKLPDGKPKNKFAF
ncbi:inorganic pyrophosphatase, partial [Suhomyces tanzawaensis NRRL Y-17324]